MNKSALTLLAVFAAMPSGVAGEYLGRLGGNRFCGDCSANPWAPINNPYNPNSLTNRFGPYGNRFSAYSPYNRFATETPAIYGEDPGYGSSANDVESNEDTGFE